MAVLANTDILGNEIRNAPGTEFLYDLSGKESVFLGILKVTNISVEAMGISSWFRNRLQRIRTIL